MNVHMELTLHGRPVTKKNHPQIVRAGKRNVIVPSQQYREYERECIAQISDECKQKIDTAVNVQCIYYMPTHRSVDLLNLMAATMDILVKAGVLEDDNCRIVATHDGSRVDYDKDDPRVAIIITPKE